MREMRSYLKTQAELQLVSVVHAV